MRGAGSAGPAIGRADVQDRAGPLCRQPPQCELAAAVIGAVQDDIDHGAKSVRCHLLGGRGEIARGVVDEHVDRAELRLDRSEEHTSELQSLMRISYAVFCLKTKHFTQNYEQ